MKKDNLQKKFSKKHLEQMIQDCRSNSDYFTWKSFRHFITQAIHKDGTFLDIGCANGFLLKCLMEWISFKIIPYGIDNRDEAIKKAREIFPEFKNNFETLSGDELFKLKNTKFPEKFDFIYRNYWGREIENIERIKEIISELLSLLNSSCRLILGFYCGNADPIGSLEHCKERVRLEKWVKIFKEAYPSHSGEAFSDSGSNHWIMWIDKKI